MKQETGNTKRGTGNAGRSLLLAAALLIMCWLSVVECRAATYSLGVINASIEDLSSNAEGKYAWTSGEILTRGATDIYSITIPTSGYVQVVYQGWSIGTGYVEFLNTDFSQRFGSSDVGSSESSPTTKTCTYAVEAGNYNIRISGNYYWGHFPGTYRVCCLFAPAENTETEPNESYSTATKLNAGSANSITGFLSETDTKDYYRLTSTVSQKAKFTYISTLNRSYFNLYNAAGKSVLSKGIDGGSESRPITVTYEADLDVGDYYIKISDDTNTGRYFLSWEKTTTSVTSITISGNKSLTAGSSTTLSATVLPQNATNSSVSWTSSDVSIARVTSAGKVTGLKPGQVTITAAAKDGSGVSGSIQVTVVPKNVKKFSVSSKAKRTMTVSWKKLSGVSGYQIQYSTSRGFWATASKLAGASKTSLKIRNLTRKRRYYVRIRAYKIIGSQTYYGSWSSIKSVKVK